MSFNRTAVVCANEPSTERLRLIKLELAAEDSGDMRGAIDICRSILAVKPDDAVTMDVVAGLYGKLGQFKTELDWSHKAIKTDPSYGIAYINLGNAHFYLGRHDLARAAFSKAKELAPADPRPLYSLGVVEEEEHHLLSATDWYEKSIKLDPKFQPGLYNLAAMYANAKRYDEALTTLDKLLALNPGSKPALEMRAKIISEQSAGAR